MWRKPQSTFSLLYKRRHFFVTKHLRGYGIDAVPSFDPEGLAFFRRQIEKASCYVEYGSGGSTIEAIQHARMTVSVESDRVFAKTLQAEIARQVRPERNEVNVIYANVGFTEEWGYPVFTRPTSRRLRAWQRYVTAPWDWMRHHGFKPDTVLIDGRFRVASALESLIRCGHETCIMVDDYPRRKFYHIIERHADLVAVHGGMAEFRKPRNFSLAECRKDQSRYWENPD